MGSCRMRIEVSQDLFNDGPQEAFSRQFSSDTTIREVAESCPVLWKLIVDKQKPFRLWDCTSHPPKDITDWPTIEYPEDKGPKSMTLFDAGCFPSGKWLALPDTVDPSAMASMNVDFDDYQYNKPEDVAIDTKGNGAGPKLKDPSLLLPSQVLESVTKRFDDDDGGIESAGKSGTPNLKQRSEIAKQKLAERFEKLDAKIAKLDNDGSKNANVTTQVRNMLIKSRATGDKRLKMQDRRYFRCILDDHGEASQEHRYFSPQDSFAKIPLAFKPIKDRAEVLVGNDEREYQRLPAGMRVYEAVSSGFLSSNTVNTLIIRWFSSDEEHTPPISINTTDLITHVDAAMKEDGDPPSTQVAMDVAAEDVSDDPPDDQVSSGPSAPMGTSIVKDGHLSKLLDNLNSKSKKGPKTEKQLATALKVRQMKMKSKAKGDAKRIPKMEQRFFVEVIRKASDDKMVSAFHFFGLRDQLSKLIPSGPEHHDLLISRDNDMFLLVDDTSLTFSAAGQSDIIHSFGTIIVRMK